MDYSAAIAHLQQADPVMARLIARLGPCELGQKIQPAVDVFSSLARSIIYQRISIKAANTVYSRFLALYDDRPFPSTQDLLNTPDETLRGAGLSLTKVSYLKDLAQLVQQGLPDLPTLAAMEDEAIIKALTQVKGIGRWSVQMLLIFQLQRLDVFPVDDLGLRIAVRDAYGLEEAPGKKLFETIAQPWQPYRTIACWYLWRSRDVAQGKLLDSWG